jgi:tryptophanyl-tRNA synthetase
MNEDELSELKNRYTKGGEGYGHFKKDLLAKITEYFAPYTDKREYYLNNPQEVKEILADGANKARAIAKTKLEIVKDAVGLNY